MSYLVRFVPNSGACAYPALDFSPSLRSVHPRDILQSGARQEEHSRRTTRARKRDIFQTRASRLRYRFGTFCAK